MRLVKTWRTNFVFREGPSGQTFQGLGCLSESYPTSQSASALYGALPLATFARKASISTWSYAFRAGVLSVSFGPQAIRDPIIRDRTRSRPSKSAQLDKTRPFWELSYKEDQVSPFSFYCHLLQPSSSLCLLLPGHYFLTSCIPRCSR